MRGHDWYMIDYVVAIKKQTLVRHALCREAIICMVTSTSWPVAVAVTPRASCPVCRDSLTGIYIINYVVANNKKSPRGSGPVQWVREQGLLVQLPLSGGVCSGSGSTASCAASLVWRGVHRGRDR
eukprot:jgi/Botrbrau1/10568/Bobra.0343s0016.1